MKAILRSRAARVQGANLDDVRLARADLGSGVYHVLGRGAGASATRKVLLTR